MRNRTWWKFAAAPVAALLLAGLSVADSPNKTATAARGAGARAACSKKGSSAVSLVEDSQDTAKKDVKNGDDQGGRKGAGFKGGTGGKRGKRGKGVAGFGFPGGGKRGGRTLDADQIVERLMSFDKNKDGKVTKDELPERLQNLIARGDTNKDGALDRDEIKKLAADLAKDGFGFGFGGRGGRGNAFGGFGGRGAGFGGFGSRGAGFGPRGGTQRALDDLNLPAKTKDKAEAVVKAHQENVHKLLELARTDLLVKMKDVLSESEYKKFKATLERLPGPGLPAATAVGEGDLERRVDRLQKELETLRREIKR
jgi:hypothetical protein